MRKSCFIKLSLFLVACSLVSCGFSDSWQETESHIKYWGPSQDLFGKYVWTGHSFYGVANGEGDLNKVNRKGEIKSSTHYYATLGLLTPNDKLQLDNSWKYWGDEKDGIPHGLGVIERPDSAMVIGHFKNGKSDTVYVFKNDQMIYTGGWKNYAYNDYGVLKTNDGKVVYQGKYREGDYHGKGILFYENGKVKYKGKFANGLYDGIGKLYQPDGQLEYEGKFRRGKFNGYGVLHYGTDSIEAHVWLMGSMNPKYAPLYQNLENHKSNLSSSKYLSYKKHLVNYERFAILWKCMIVLSIALFIFIMSRIFAKRVNVKYLFKQPEPINKKKMYIVWAIGGLLGVHRILLSSWVGFISMALVAIAIICNLTPITLYAGHYDLLSSFVGWIPQFYVAIACVSVCVVLWLIDAVWVAYRIYYLTNTYYRHDAREMSLLRGHSTDVDRLMTSLARDLPKILSNMQSAISRSKNISKEKVKHTSWFGRTFKYGEKDLEESKYNRIYSNVYDVQNMQGQMLQYSNQLSEYLEEARINTYRNIYLAKEIIKYFRDKVSSKEQVLQQDKQITIRNVSIASIDAKDVEINVDAMSAIQTFDMSFSMLSNAGLSSGACLGFGLVFSTALVALNYLQQRNEALEKYAQGVKCLIENLNSISNESIKLESQLLRMNELLGALYQCNIAYIKAYVKIRDQAFPAPSFMNFIKGVNKRNPYFSSVEFKKDMALLIQVTSEYNKVNTAKIIN